MAICSHRQRVARKECKQAGTETRPYETGHAKSRKAEFESSNWPSSLERQMEEITSPYRLHPRRRGTGVFHRTSRDGSS